jgi:endonuclease/exonuclease/phosphatase family metal-dependent hydrolase
MAQITFFNTASTFGDDKRSDWLRSVKVLESCRPDACACAEVTVHEDFVPDLDMPALYSDYLNMEVIFGRATSRDSKGDYGVMALSKYPIRQIDKILLPTPCGFEQRICLITKIDACQPYYFCVSHFSTREEYPGAAETRIAAIALITARLMQLPEKLPAVLCGDFNCTPDSREIDFLRTLWDVANDSAAVTATHHSGEMLDYICTFPKAAASIQNFKVGPITIASDHYPVSANIEFN